jgi:hypothetical protein
MRIFDCFREMRTLDCMILALVLSTILTAGLRARDVERRLKVLEAERVTAVTADSPG